MSNERTALYFTWQKSHLCGAQKVSTLVRLAQTQQWEKNADSSTRKVRRPTVRFCDLNFALRMQQNRPARDPNQDVGHEDERAHEAESDSSADSEGEFDYDGLNNEYAKGATRDLWGASRPTRQYDSEPGDRFVVSDVADLQSLALQDLLSDTPLVVAKSSQPVPIIQRGPPRRLREFDYTM
ncbi:hypothetical protein BC835DRAFT_1459777 [Cytidiella melzeri]|nr:hypothetical protein BC835DRAFT_1459777 [Cytidiella melzeri]